MSTQPLTIVAVTTAKPGMGPKLRAAQEVLVADTLKVEGCLSYTLNQSLDNSDVLVFVETWENETVWRAHMEGEAMRRFQATGVGQLFAGATLFRLNQVAG